MRYCLARVAKVPIINDDVGFRARASRLRIVLRRNHVVNPRQRPSAPAASCMIRLKLLARVATMMLRADHSRKSVIPSRWKGSLEPCEGSHETLTNKQLIAIHQTMNWIYLNRIAYCSRVFDLSRNIVHIFIYWRLESVCPVKMGIIGKQNNFL